MTIPAYRKNDPKLFGSRFMTDKTNDFPCCLAFYDNRAFSGRAF